MKTIVFAVALSLAGSVQAQTAAPAAQTAALGPVSGSVQYQQGGSDAWFFAKLGRDLPAGTVVRTEAGSYCLVFLSGGTKLRLGPRSTLRVAGLAAERTELALDSGRLEAWVKKAEKSEVQVRTPIFKAAQPEGSFAAEILSANSAVLDLFLGDTRVEDATGRAQTLSAGNRVEFDAKTGASTPAPFPAAAVRPVEPGFSGPAKPAQEPPPAKAEPKKAPAAPPAPKAEPKKGSQEIDDQL